MREGVAKFSMMINEIEKVDPQNFPEGRISDYLKISRPLGMLEGFGVNYIESGDQRIVILADDGRKVAAYAGFIVRHNGKIWQAKNAQTYPPYSGRALVGKIYKLVKEKLGKSIQSDVEQTDDGMKLWQKTLPSLGLHPMVFDTSTEKIADPNTFDTDLMYPVTGDPSDPIQWRYCWILERHDHYPDQNLMNESSLLMPYTGMWYNPKLKRK